MMTKYIAVLPAATASAVGLDISLNNVWLLIATFLVIFMQPGFAMVEVGFTRAKNATNILMKNLMDFSFGSLIFWFIGYSLMYGTGNDFIGDFSMMAFNPVSDSFGGGYSDFADIMFQTAFAATAATIVSGAMAERTNFSAYIIFSIIITLVIYPVSGHWTWGGGWLSKLGFIDFAGSTIVHSVGAWVGLAGAIILGPRIGKYSKDGKPKAIPGHNMVIGTLGVFILWFSWFGFNCGSELSATGESTTNIARVALTTNLAAAAGAVVAMMVTWIQYKRPTLSLTLNGALAGLVAITAGTAVVSPAGALAIGAIAGMVLVFAVEFIDQKLKIDDPVGAISVHGVSGALGTLLVGVFATDGGLLYGGGYKLLGIQAIGVFAIGAWAFAMGFILFKILNAFKMLRVEKVVEEEGLNIFEHGESAYN